jgi:AcrR family transcriptional regulator
MRVNPGGERLRVRHGVPGPRGGSLFVSELQRARLLDATFAVVAEQGYRGMAVRAVAERAGVSSKTFYGLFTDREDCFLAAFDHGIDGLTACVRVAYEDEKDWVAGVRAALIVLLDVLDREPALRRVLFVEALAAGPRVLARRAQVMTELAGVVDGGRGGMKRGWELSPLTAYGVVGAATSMVHAQLLQEPPGALSDLLGALMSVIVLPYRGHGAAARELRGSEAFSSGRKNPAGVKSPACLARGQSAPPLEVLRPLGSGPVSDFRLTVRTQRVLAAVAELAGRGSSPSNREVSDLAGISDQGQISRLMMRLSDRGLVQNTGGGGQGAAKAWRLTVDGEAIVKANPLSRERADASPASTSELLAASHPAPQGAKR